MRYIGKYCGILDYFVSFVYACNVKMPCINPTTGELEYSTTPRLEPSTHELEPLSSNTIKLCSEVYNRYKLSCSKLSI